MGLRISQLRPAQNSSANNANAASDLRGEEIAGNLNKLHDDFAQSQIETSDNLKGALQNGAASTDSDLTAANGVAQPNGKQQDGAPSRNEKYSTLQRQATQIQSFAQRLKRSASVRTKSFKTILPSFSRRKVSVVFNYAAIFV